MCHIPKTERLKSTSALLSLPHLVYLGATHFVTFRGGCQYLKQMSTPALNQLAQGVSEVLVTTGVVPRAPSLRPLVFLGAGDLTGITSGAVFVINKQAISIFLRHYFLLPLALYKLQSKCFMGAPRPSLPWMPIGIS